jgi:hypothetical protein
MIHNYTGSAFLFHYLIVLLQQDIYAKFCTENEDISSIIGGIQ